jgi:hypothetical protein
VTGAGDAVLAIGLAVLTLATVVVVDGLLTVPDAGPDAMVARMSPHAGPDRTVPQGTLVRLDGRGAEDARGDGLTFSWRFLEKPAGSLTVLVGARTALPIFLADRDGLYVVELVVSDGRRESASNRVRITVRTPPLI